ncbi:hypothetical protein [Gordonia sp. OPL2]|uniref:hypothetical protein n=1 Tax=Gordonia sp. OPL2 TaxID=2486274 RepID=UPI00165593FB|nr:hypothetical protein [Gordonia sp. OPL2]ROZ88648.1 hypothetical protein EEB19_21735 [Gordonia sp. OPL2]
MRICPRRLLVAACGAALAFVPGAAAGASPNGSLDPVLPPGFPCIHTNVYPVATWGWVPLSAHAPRFVTGPAGASGNGSLDLLNPRGAVNYFHLGINTPLNQLASQRYALGFQHQGRYVSYQLRVRGADRTDRAASGFSTLVWEPRFNGGIGNDRMVTSRDLARGRWWSTSPIAGLPTRDQAIPLTEIARLNTRAFVTEYGVQNTSSEAAFVDNLVYGCAKWDFQPMPAGS